jgi:hypothetical protein
VVRFFLVFEKCLNKQLLVQKICLSLIYQITKTGAQPYKGRRKYMFFFKNCESVEQVKNLYRELAKQHHPDRGGDTETMQRLNTEYAFAIAKILNGESLSQDEINEEIRLSEKHREVLEKIATLEGLIIELVGSWIWVSGNTYPVKGVLSEAGFFWASQKKKWYFRQEQNRVHNGGKTLNMDQIKAKYGSTTINNRRKELK